MPESHYRWLPRPSILRFEEMVQIVAIAQEFGVNKVRITGGEPLLRLELAKLVELLTRLTQPLEALALTTNGVLLGQQALALWEAGLRHLTVSLDSIRSATFEAMAQRDDLSRVLDGLETAKSVGFQGIKLDTVILRGHNDDQVLELLQFARAGGYEIRFIEYMDVGGATDWSADQVLPKIELLGLIERGFGAVARLSGRGSAPAERFALKDGTVFGIIASTSEPFCRDCDRARLTADGHWLTCLYAKQGLSVRDLLRKEGPDSVRQAISKVWPQRVDQGAVERLQTPGRSSFVSLDELRQNPQLEMHTRGG